MSHVNFTESTCIVVGRRKIVNKSINRSMVCD